MGSERFLTHSDVAHDGNMWFDDLEEITQSCSRMYTKKPVHGANEMIKNSKSLVGKWCSNFGVRRSFIAQISDHRS